MKIYYLVYQLTNSVNGKIYIGCHMTRDVNDDYMGSGKRLGYAKKKHGIENFKKEILSIHETPEQMFAEEARLVNEKFIERDDVYNLTCGGKGSWLFTNKNLTPEQRTKAGKAGGYANRTFEQRSAIGKITGPKTIDRIRLNRTGIKHSIETKNKMSITRRTKRLQSGIRNSQYGKKWMISSTGICIKVNKEKCNLLLLDGYKFGRLMKHDLQKENI